MSSDIKTLFCVICQTRASHVTYPSLETNVLKPLGADLALCISDSDGTEMHKNAKYIWSIPEPQDWNLEFDNLAKECGANESWKNLLANIGGAMGPIFGNEERGSGAILFYFRMFLYKSLIDNNLLDKYDRFIISRSDHIYIIPHVPLEMLDEEFIWVPKGEEYEGITDRYAILSKQNVEAYLTLLNDVFKNLHEVKASHNPETFILNQLKERGFKDSIKKFPRFMYSIRTNKCGTRWSQGTKIEGLDYLLKYTTEYYDSKTTKEQWEKLGWEGILK